MCKIFVERKHLGVFVPEFWPAPLVFIEPMKISISLLRKLNVRIIIYRSNMLLTSKLHKEIFEVLDSLILLLQQLGLVIFKEKSQFQPAQEI